MQTNDKERTRQLIEEYNRRLMATYRQAAPLPSSPPPDNTAGKTADTAWLEENFPLPNIERDKAAMTVAEPMAANDIPPASVDAPTAPVQESPTATDEPQFPYSDDALNGQVPRDEQPPAPPTIGESPYIGYMRVYTFTGSTAEPIEGATVTVTRPQGEQDELYATATTNADGFTPVLPLPSVSPALTMRPDIPFPYVAYDIRVSAPGFRPVIYENVPVYGNNYVTQSASLLPLIPGQDANEPLITRSGAPTNL